MNLRRSLRYTFFFLGLTIVCPTSISIAKDSEEDPRLPLAMEVFLKKPKVRQYTIHIHLTNISREPVIVDVHDLPWNPPNDSKWLSVFRMDSKKSPLTQRYHKWEVGSQDVRLLPGESIQNKLPLNTRLPSLLSDIDQHGVQIHWDCPPPSLRFVCKSGAPHTLTIPKKDPGKPDMYSTNKKMCQKLEETIGLVSIPDNDEVLFLHTTEPVITDLQKAQSLLYRVDDYVQQCQPRWTNSWSVSFFTERKFAGYLKDEEGERAYERGLWQQANIGHYSSQIRTLYRFPWIKKKSDTVYLSVYR